MVETYLVKGRQKSRQTELQKSPGHGGFTRGPTGPRVLLFCSSPIFFSRPHSSPNSNLCPSQPQKQSRAEQKRKREAKIIATRLLPLLTRNHQLALLKKITKLPLSSAVH
jgi:hypothetical protein